MADMTREIDMPLSSAADDVLAGAVLAVIPALNEARHIEACIRSLMTGSPDLRRVTLTVADGGSTDDTVAIVTRLMAEFPNLQVLDNPKRLQAAALNLAARELAGPNIRILVRCDAHSIYPENFILDVAEALSKTGAESLVVPMDAVGETCFEKGNAWVVDTPLGSGGSAHRGGKVSGWVDHGHHAGFDIDWFRRLGGYDETFAQNEDAEYDVRLGKAGGRIYMDATIRIAYVPRGSVRKLWKQYAGYGRGRARNAQKHGHGLKFRQAAPVLALVGIVAGILASPVFWPALLLPLGYIGILAAASILVAISRKSACGLFAGIAAGTMHLGWAVGYLREAFGLNRR